MISEAEILARTLLEVAFLAEGAIAVFMTRGFLSRAFRRLELIVR